METQVSRVIEITTEFHFLQEMSITHVRQTKPLAIWIRKVSIALLWFDNTIPTCRTFFATALNAL